MLSRFSLLFAFMLCTIIPLYSSSFYFDKITTRSGLSQSSVFSIIQDHRGKLWFGTYDGLNCYNGHEFTVFRPQKNNPYAITNNEINTLFEDRQHRLWISFLQKGINCFNPRTERFIHYSRSAEGEDITGIYANAFVEDRQGTVWMATEQGLFFIDAQGKVHRDKSELGIQPLTTVFFDKQGNLWLGKENGEVWQKKTGTNGIKRFSLKDKDKQLIHTRINFIYQSQEGAIFVCTLDSGLWKLSPQKHIFESYLYFPGELQGRNNMHKILANKNHVWIATDGGLIHADSKLSLTSVECIKASPDRIGTLSSHSVQDICLDHADNLWIGFWEAGGVDVIYAHNSPFRLLTSTDGLPANKVTGIAYARGQYYAATGKGVTVFDRRFKKINTLLPFKDVNGIAANQDYILFGVWNDGFYLLSTKKQELQHFTKPLQPNFKGFISLSYASISSNGIWLCHASEYATIYFMDFATRRILPITDFKLSSSISSICESTLPNILWVGTPDKGLWIYNLQTHTWKNIHLNEAYNDNSNDRDIICIQRDDNRHIWVGTRGGGLFLLDETGKVLQRYNAEHGLASNVIHSLRKDRQGALWAATNEGLSRFNPHDRSFRNYSENDELGGKEFIDYAAEKGPEGQLLFGGIHGLNLFYPDSIADNPVKPIVAFTDLLLLNQKTIPLGKGSPLKQSIDFTQKIRLSHRQSAAITFEYVGIYFGRNHQCSYAYKLEGFDQKWNKVGSRRAATYTNLNPGHYTFRVKAANPEGGWNEAAKSIQVHILPPWYLQWWAFGLYFGLLILGFLQYSAYIRNREQLKSAIQLKELEASIRVEEAQKRNEELRAFNHSIGHDLAAPVNKIHLFSQKIDAQKLGKEAQIYLEKISMLSKDVLLMINGILQYAQQDLMPINQSVFETNRVVSFLVESIKEDNAGMNIQFILRDLPNQAGDPLMLRQVFTNLIQNAVKFSSTKNPILIEIYGIKKAHSQEFYVKDYGIGFPPKAAEQVFELFKTVHDRENYPGVGAGLAIVKRIIERHGGKVWAEPNPSGGAIFGFSLPVDSNKKDFK